MKKTANNIFNPIIKFFDKKIITPITKLIVKSSSKFDNSGKKLEKILSKQNTLLFVSLFLAALIFIIIDQKIVNFSDNTAEVLKDREKLIIEMRFGLDGNKPKTQNQIAKILGISRSYVSRIETKAIGKLAKEVHE